MTEVAVHSRADVSDLAGLDGAPGFDLSAQLLRRVRVALATIAGALLITTIVDVPAGILRPAPLFGLKGAALLLVGFAYAIVRQKGAQRYALVIAWLVPATSCLALSLSGIATGESHGAVIMCLGAVLMAATLFPWGAQAQLASAAFAGAAIAANIHWVSGKATLLINDQAAVAVVATLAASVVVTYERELTRRALRAENLKRASAEAGTATLNKQLERLVLERTAQLEVTRIDLEREVAGHVAALAALRSSEQRLLDIVDNSPALTYVKDLEGRYRFMGIACARRFGIPRDQIVGKTAADLFPAETAVAFGANDRVVLTSGQAIETEDVVPHPDGPPHTYLSLKFPLRDATGVTYGLCGVATDITLRKRMENDLRRAEAQLSSVIESSHEAIWSLDHEYRFTALNWVVKRRFRELFDTQPELGVRVDACLPLAAWAHWRTPCDAALAGRPLTVEHSVTVEGRAVQLLVSFNPIFEDGAVTGIVCFTKEITSLRRAAEEMRQHEADLAHALRLSTIGEIASGLAQYLHRPLAVITESAHACRQALRGDPVDTALLAHHADQMTVEALAATQPLRHLRRLVRKQSPDYTNIDVNEAARRAAEIAQVRYPRLPLQLVLAANLPCAHGDAIQLEQVVLNLLLNARDALAVVPEEDQTVLLQTALVDRNTIEITVRDNGSGMDPAIADRLFEPFLTTKPQALGMGLAISHMIAEAHHGRLWVTPNVERGCTFHFTLPVP